MCEVVNVNNRVAVQGFKYPVCKNKQTVKQRNRFFLNNSVLRLGKVNSSKKYWEGIKVFRFHLAKGHKANSDSAASSATPHHHRITVPQMFTLVFLTRREGDSYPTMTRSGSLALPFLTQQRPSIRPAAKEQKRLTSVPFRTVPLHSWHTWDHTASGRTGCNKQRHYHHHLQQRQQQQQRDSCDWTSERVAILCEISLGVIKRHRSTTGEGHPVLTCRSLNWKLE